MKQEMYYTVHTQTTEYLQEQKILESASQGDSSLLYLQRVGAKF